MIKRLGLVLLLISPVSVALAEPGDYANGSYHHTVHAGERLQIANARSWGPAPDCESTGAKVVLTQRPAHGTLTMDRVTTTVPSDHDDCAGHPVITLRVFYTPSRRYQGEDHIAYDEIFGNGGPDRHVDESIDVAAALIPVRPGQVFASVPPSGSLKTGPGTIVFIEDGSCPTGQIKQMVTGSEHPLIARQFSCVRR